MASVTLNDVRKAYGKHEVIHGVDLEVRSGEFMVLVGPSGCGKSTLLRMIAGLEEITDGLVSIGGKVVNELPASQRTGASHRAGTVQPPAASVRSPMKPSPIPIAIATSVTA